MRGERECKGIPTKDGPVGPLDKPLFHTARDSDYLWDLMPVRNNNEDGLFSVPYTAFDLSVVGPTGICFPWQRCGAPPRQQTSGCPLHTHGLGNTSPCTRNTDINTCLTEGTGAEILCLSF